jgi:formiminotetrahydrofolate cyclodeaminase
MDDRHEELIGTLAREEARRSARPAVKWAARSTSSTILSVGGTNTQRTTVGHGVVHPKSPNELAHRNRYLTIRHRQSDMTFADQSISEFLEDVAASAVTPSGGAVAAVGGASGAALCEMVCIHTIEKDGYADVRAELTDICDELETHRARLLELADEDSMAVDELQAAFETPNDEDRAELVQEKLRHAIEVPLEVAEVCLDVLEGARVVTVKGNRNALADAGTGAFLAHSALKASVFTIQHNLELIEDSTAVAEVEDCLARIGRRGDEALEQVKANVEETA